MSDLDSLSDVEEGGSEESTQADRAWSRMLSCIRAPLRPGKKQGETTSKGNKNYELMLNLQLGIRHAAVWQFAPTSLDLKASAFGPKEKVWTRFSPKGSQYTLLTNHVIFGGRTTARSYSEKGSDAMRNCSGLQEELARGGEVGRINIAGGAGIGPLRCWPGGLCLSRSIGDTDVGEYIVPIPHVKQVKLSNAGGRLVIASDGVWDALCFQEALNYTRGLPAEAAANRIVKEAVSAKGLQDDTTCIVVDILPPEKLSPPLKRHGKGGIKVLFRWRISDELSKDHMDNGRLEPNVVKELYEEGSAMLAQRLNINYPAGNMFKLHDCPVCQLEMKPGEGVSVHGNMPKHSRVDPWGGPFLCSFLPSQKGGYGRETAFEKHEYL